MTVQNPPRRSHTVRQPTVFLEQRDRSTQAALALAMITPYFIFFTGQASPSSKKEKTPSVEIFPSHAPQNRIGFSP
jgi:hypothetical protein